MAYGQNAHSMSLAVRADVELFRSVKREKEPDGEILDLIDLSKSSDVQLHEECLWVMNANALYETLLGYQ